MLHIILLILKIIGIVLLCILGVLLISIICALFVPVRYRVRLVREEGEEKPPFTAYVKITWLLHLVNILVRYPADVTVRVRLMLFTLFRLPKKESKKAEKAVGEQKGNIQRKKTEETSRAETDATKKPTQADNGESQIPTNFEESHISTEEAKNRTRPDTDIAQKSMPTGEDYEAFDSSFIGSDGTTDTEQEPDSLQQESDVDEKENFSLPGKIREIIDKIKQFVEKIKAFFKNIQYTIRKFCDKIKSVLDNIEYYRAVLESEPFKQSLQLCQSELKSVFKALKPDKFETAITIGMDDPATTGQILAIYGMLYPFIGQNIQITGDFERTHVEGNIYIRGKIRAFTFLRAAIRVYFNKDLKKLIKLFKKEAV